MYNCEIIKGTEDGEVCSEMTLFIMRSVITALAPLTPGGRGMVFRESSVRPPGALVGGIE